MSEYYASIAVKGSGVEQLKDFLKNEIGYQFLEKTSRMPLDLVIEVEDYGSELEYTGKFMSDHGIEEVDPILRELNLIDFKVNVELNFSRNTLISDVINHLTDSLGRRISNDLKLETAVFFPGAEVPYCIYKNGQILRKIGSL